MNKIQSIIKNIKDSTITNINMEMWNEYNLCDFFEIEKGMESSSLSGNNGNINLIVAAKTNNGIAKKISDGKKLFSGNKITLCCMGDGAAGLAFYQKEQFYATSGVYILTPSNKKYKWELNENIGLFFVTNIKHFKKVFNHNNSLNDESFKKMRIKLPTINNEPNWDRIEKFIINLKKELNLL